jgi:subtilisin family serine protease
MTRRLSAAALAASLTALVAGCAGASLVTAPAGSPPPAGAPRAEVEGGPASTDRQVMITYPPGPPSLWAQKTRELETIYRLRTVWSWTLTSLGEQCVVFEVPRGRTVPDIVRRLGADPRVGSIQPIETFETQSQGQGQGGATNDPYAKLQHSAKTLRLDQAHKWSTGRGVRVAVVDTGVDLDHPDLRGRIVVAHNFVDRGEQTFTSDVHGTAVAGVLAAAANDIGIIGVAPQAEILALKACWQQPPGAREAVCNSYTLAKAVDFAIAQGAQVLNFSLAGPPDPLLGRLIGAALGKGISVVAADGGDAAHSFPASLPGVIGIAGLDGLKGGVRVVAGRRSTATLAAPAVDILTTVPHASYDFFSGSSFAAAQVSGIAALLLEKNPRITPAQIAVLIRKTAHPVPGMGLNGAAASIVSQVDACAALSSALGAGGCE